MCNFSAKNITTTIYTPIYTLYTHCIHYITLYTHCIRAMYTLYTL
jgi:hypothetical protein